MYYYKEPLKGHGDEMRWDMRKNYIKCVLLMKFSFPHKKIKCSCSHKTGDGNNMTIEEKLYFNAFETEHKLVEGAQYFCKRTQKFCE